MISEGEHAKDIGVTFKAPKIDLEQTLKWKSGIINQLTQGLTGLAKKRKVTVLQGEGQFKTANIIEVTSEAGIETISFDKIIIAAGSEAVEIPGFPRHERVMDSTGALQLNDIPKKTADCWRRHYWAGNGNRLPRAG